MAACLTTRTVRGLAVGFFTGLGGALWLRNPPATHSDPATLATPPPAAGLASRSDQPTRAATTRELEIEELSAEVSRLELSNRMAVRRGFAEGFAAPALAGIVVRVEGNYCLIQITDNPSHVDLTSELREAPLSLGVYDVSDLKRKGAAPEGMRALLAIYDSSPEAKGEAWALSYDASTNCIRCRLVLRDDREPRVGDRAFTGTR